MADSESNPLISLSRASDTSPAVQLHPLVLLTISDCVTRHQARQQDGPVVGAIIGQQNGQEITMEVAFQAKLNVNEDGEAVLDDEWFQARIEDYKAVYKQPPLDLVGWFSISSPSGPAPFHIPLHTHISEIYVESPILFLFHPSQVYTDATAAGKLPITLYESVFEVGNNRDDKAMDIDGAAQAKTLKFRELTYSIETGEAEMISVDFVARGGGNASAVEGPTSSSQQPGFSQETQKSEPETPKSKKGKGKAKEKQAAKTEEPVAEANYLTPEDEELLSSLTAKSNAIKMLSRRIDLLRAYLSSLPPSYLTDPGLEVTPDVDAGHQLPLDHTILRSINALLARLPILVPSETEQFILESQQEASDVQLIALLSSIQNSIATVKEAGRKHQIVELARAQGKKGPMGLGSVIHGFESATPTTTSFFDNGFPLDGKALRERALNSGAGGGWGPSEYLG